MPSSEAASPNPAAPSGRCVVSPTGKTHLAVALGREAIRQNYSVQFVTAATLGAMLTKAHGDGTLDKQLTLLARPKLLIIDELGYRAVCAACA
ncbi:IstB ATP binding domain-containing protein, partial [Novosphingobium sp. Rr 2-17]